GDERLDLVQRGVGRERTLELRRNGAGEVADRAERPRDRQVVARSEQHARVRLKAADEAANERRLANAGLSGDEDSAALAARGSVACLHERSKSLVSLEQLDGQRLHPV